MAATDVDVNTQICKATLTRLQNSLCHHLTTRCQEIKQLIQEASLRDLQGIFPSLVMSIFGFPSNSDWGLIALTRNNSPREFESLRNFLNPDDGPLLSLAYRLLAEGCPQYKFPTSCLPNHGGQTLEEGPFSSLFPNKPTGQTFGSLPSSLGLNAFEFYFFHFAYYITSHEMEKRLPLYPSLDPSNILCMVLLEDYLNYFLPMDGSSVPAIPVSPSIHSSTTQQTSPSSLSSSVPQSQFSHFSALASPMRPSPHQSLLRHRPSLLKPGTPLSVPPSPGSGAPGSVEASPAEIWRSEAFVFILSEMYLSQNTQAMQRSKPSSFLETFIPNPAHVWMVRAFIKYLHYFANSAKSSSHLPNYPHMSLNALEQLKCTVIQKFVRKKFYKFMKSIFDHWPLDASFKLPLEAWLSYIQPWRYISHSQSRSLSDEKRDAGNIDSKWQKFVCENILFYTLMFQQVLKKFLRMDLSCPKNASMLFRFSKIFVQNNVSAMIKEAESCSQDVTSKSSSVLLSSSYNSIHRAEISPSSGIRQQLSDLEVAGCEYVPLFSRAVFAEVSQLLWMITAARRKARQHSETCKKIGIGWLSQLGKYFDYDGKYSNGDRGSSDVRKVDQNLEAAATNFCEIFGLQSPALSPHLSSSDAQHQLQSSMTCTPMKNGLTQLDELTPQQRYQLMNGFQKAEVKYQGHPDTQPIRSFEIGFLVRMLWQISSFLNMKFSREIRELYCRCDVIGRMCHQLLSPPVTYYKVLKSSSMQSSPRVPVHLPPRVNLRCLANKQIVGYFLLLLIVGMYFSYHPVTVVLVVLAIVLFVVFLKAVFSSPKAPGRVA